MPNAMHHNDLFIILKVADYTIVSNTKAPESTHVSLQHLRTAELSWIRGQRETSGQFLLDTLRCLPV